MRSKIGLMLTAAMFAAGPVSAHHGAGVFEPEKKVTVSGTVTDFQFVNPHVLVYLTVKGGDGKEVQWGGELTSPNRLARDERAVKWHKEILKPGDAITVTGHPARNGAPMMDILKIVDAHGTVLIDDE
ncbi:MAG TPA: DUF6152 family protein [Gammaproteobacteria bacterium]|nr:DUF6152 family protein [Gammaproteobacteria bacterium]